MSWLAAFALGIFIGGTLGVLLLSALVVGADSDDRARADLLEIENAELRRQVRP